MQCSIGSAERETLLALRWTGKRTDNVRPERTESFPLGPLKRTDVDSLKEDLQDNFALQLGQTQTTVQQIKLGDSVWRR